MSVTVAMQIQLNPLPSCSQTTSHIFINCYDYHKPLHINKEVLHPIDNDTSNPGSIVARILCQLSQGNQAIVGLLFVFVLSIAHRTQMSSILLKGYNTQGCRIQNKEGQDLDDQYLQRYQCVQCKFILRWPYQMICGDRVCRGCFPSV